MSLCPEILMGNSGKQEKIGTYFAKIGTHFQKNLWWEGQWFESLSWDSMGGSLDKSLQHSFKVSLVEENIKANFDQSYKHSEKKLFNFNLSLT